MRFSGRQRTVEMVDFDWPRGPVSIDALIAMPFGQSEHICTEITRWRQEDPARPLARCRLYGGSAYIKRQPMAEGHLACPIHVERPLLSKADFENPEGEMTASSQAPAFPCIAMAVNERLVPT